MRTKKSLAVGGFTLCVTSAILLMYAHTKTSTTTSLISRRWGMNEWGIKYGSQAHSSPALYYCNFPTAIDAVIAEEGKPPNPRWILRQVQVVIRHGDRSPINSELYKKLGVYPGYCQLKPDRQPTHPSLRDFVMTMTADQTRMRMQGRKLLLPPFPNYPLCGSAILSQLGVIQHLNNGELLRKAYFEDHGLLSDSVGNETALSQKVFVTSTVRSRTLQSAVAFLYGLIPDFHLHQVEIKYSNSDIFGAEPCRVIPKMEEGIKRMRYQSYLNQRQNASFKKLSKAYNMSDHSGALIDGLVTGFLCKNIRLPCNGACPSLEDLDVLLNEEEFTMQQISEKASFVNQSMLYIQPLLKRISNFMNVRGSGATAPEVVLMSGHDTTLKPLIRALGIPEYRWPRLGTRLVFELWSDPNDNEHYVRILLNGKDYTSATNPCRGNELYQKATFEQYCTAKSFYQYAKNGILKHFGAKTRKQACSELTS